MSYLDYQNKKQLGEGGNAFVYLMVNNFGQKVAVKVLKYEEATGVYITSKLERFKTEAIKIHDLYINGQKGIIPILDYELPCEETKKYFYVMPIATPLMEKVKNCKTIYEKIDIFKDLAMTLSELHKKTISHRDIKPENILFYQDKYCFGDFGLIDFPEKEDLTRTKEAIGNRKTMAPEMRTPHLVSDFRPADVYSFAKTLWIIITGEEYAFDGQLNYYENDTLQHKYPKHHFVELYKLLADATAENPSKRPTIDEFLKRLINWENISRNERAVAKSLWRFIEENVVKQNNPSTVIWRDKKQIIEILKQLSILNFNHTFINEGGGMDLIGIDEVDELNETDMVGIDFGLNNLCVFKIKRLIWELPNKDPEFSYFRLEFDKIKPIYPSEVEDTERWMQKEFEDNDKIVSEELIVNSDGEYECYREDEENSLRHITRWFDGTFLIVPKASIYNMISSTYDGRHSKFNAEELREYMEILQYIYNHAILGVYFETIANEDPFNEDFFEDLKEIRLMTDEELKEYYNMQ